MFVLPARALQLVHMDGIADGSLFRENVRYGLGNTSVNKAIRGALANEAGQASFFLGHNGLIILCSSADNSESGELRIKDYSVVNGAQTLTSFYNDKSKLTDDLRVLVRVVEVQDEALARRITENSNNQNAIKPRDLRSNHAIQLRLQREMSDADGHYFFEVKRGEKAPADATLITNRCKTATAATRRWHRSHEAHSRHHPRPRGRGHQPRTDPGFSTWRPHIVSDWARVSRPKSAAFRKLPRIA